MKCKDVFLYNFTQVFCSTGQRKTVQEIEQRREKMKEALQKRKEAQDKEKQEEEQSDFKQYTLVS